MSNYCHTCGKPFWREEGSSIWNICDCPQMPRDTFKQINNKAPVTIDMLPDCYQCCPICFGQGRLPAMNGTNMFETCTVCKGEKIIHSSTGLPPSLHNQKKQIG